MPEYATFLVCSDCAQILRSRAADRGDETDRGRLLRLAYSLAGEVWVQGDLAYWFREPVSVTKQPSAVPSYAPAVALPRPSKESLAEVAAKRDA